jgi:hypothetical protein
MNLLLVGLAYGFGAGFIIGVFSQLNKQIANKKVLDKSDTHR